MPKNADDKLYLNPAIPRNTRLAEVLEESSARSGITKSQLLVWFAAEYVRLVVDGVGVVPATSAPTIPTTASLEVKSEPVETEGNIRTLGSMTTGDEANYDNVFGDPD